MRQKTMNKMVRGGVAATVLLISLGACASGGGRRSTEVQAPSSAASVAPVTVTMTRTGGFAGVMQRVVIAPDGTWTRTDRSGATRSGKLTADQITQLQQLARDLGSSGEKAASSGARVCTDAFVYSISVGAAMIAYTDCNARPPVASHMAALITGWILTP